MTCIGKDPRCPCQDGDACHYKDCGGTKAWPVPQAEPVACRFCFSEKGCWAWQCYKCGEIDDVQQPAAQPVQEPVAWTTMPEADDWDFVSGSKDPTGKLDGKWFPLYTTPPATQRPWVGLTEDEKFEMAAMQYGWEDLLIAAEAKLKELNK